MVLPLLATVLALQKEPPTEALYRAIAGLDRAGVRRAVRAGADLHGTSKAYGEPPLFYALRWPEMFDLVRRLGAPIDGVDGYGRTLLHFLVSDRATILRNTPMEEGRPVFINLTGPPDVNGPWERREKIAADLLQHGVRLEARDVHGRTALHYAVQSGWRVVDLLMRLSEEPGSRYAQGIYGKSRTTLVNVRDAAGETPLMLLAHEGGRRVGETALIAGRLIEAEADIALRDADGRTAEDLAVKSHDSFLAAMLRAKREEPEGP